LFIYALAVAEVLFIVGVSAAAAWFAWYVMRRRRLPA
jgi:hypothetical protein